MTDLWTDDEEAEKELEAAIASFAKRVVTSIGRKRDSSPSPTPPSSSPLSSRSS